MTYQTSNGGFTMSATMSQPIFGADKASESHSEGTVARTIEQQTAKLPSDVYLWAAGGAIAASAILQLTGKPRASLFLGQWVAPFLLLGVYNKIVKVAGSDGKH
jgi:hypothetical protein